MNQSANPLAKISLVSRFGTGNSHPNTWWLMVLFGAMLPPGDGYLGAQTADMSVAAPHIILLKNGQVLEGTAITSLDRTVVETLSGSRLVLQTAHVDCVCDSWVQAWEFKRDATDAERPDELTALLRWCLRHRQFASAWEVLNQLQSVAIPAGDLDSLRRQIVLSEEAFRSAQLPRPVRPQVVAEIVPRPDVAEVTGSLLPGEESKGSVRPVSFDETVGQTSLASSNADPRVPTIAWPPARPGQAFSEPERAAEPETARPLPKDPAIPQIPDLSQNAFQPFVPCDEFDPEIFNRFCREPGTWDGTPASEIHRAARALGLPDLQSLIGKPNAPEK